MAVRRIVRAALVVVALAASLVGLDVRVAAAAAAKVQGGPLVTNGTGSLALTVPAASTAGTLLVATIAYSGSAPALAGPSGWTRGPNVSVTSGGTEIWYYAGNPGSISSATFTYSTATTAGAGGQLSEWSGVAAVSPLDKSGTATATTNVTTVTATTSGSVAAAGEVGITAFAQFYSTSGTPTFTAGSGWTNLVKTTTAGTSAFTSDSRLNLTNGSAASEQQTSSRSGTWAAAIATFKLPCTAGSLSVGSPSTLTLPAVSLTGSNTQTTSSIALTPSDLTNSGSGWNVQLTSTTFTNAASKTLSTSASTITSASVGSNAGTCVLPTNAIAYPVTVPAAATAPTAVKIYNAAAATGKGTADVTLGVRLAVPGNAYSGSYSSTWTFTIASGP